MSPEIEKKLLDKYPDIFKNLNYIECNDGWYNILDVLCSNIQQHVKHISLNLDTEEKESAQFTAEQVKEKFGGLRFYGYNSDAEIQAMIAVAESLSVRTCEYCGDKATTVTKGWIKNLCDKCSIKRREK
jgi:hypothetical protein